ncbi:MAG: restriction endonuclease subunit S [Thermoplasmata archaeon]
MVGERASLAGIAHGRANDSDPPSPSVRGTLGGLVELETGKRPRGGGLTSGAVLSIGGEHIRPDGTLNLKAPKFITEEFYKDLKHGRLRPGDVLLVKDGATTGKLALVEHLPSPHSAINEHVFIIRSRDVDRLDQTYLFFALSTVEVQSEIRGLTHGLIGGVNRPSVESLGIPLPRISEQREIVRLLSTVRDSIRATGRIIDTAREVRRALLSTRLRGGPLHEGRDDVRMVDSPIGQVSADWDISTVGNLFDIQQGKALSPKARLGNSPRPFLRTANVLWAHLDLSVVDKMNFAEEEIERYALKSGDLLICEGGEIGRTALWEGGIQLCCYQNHIHRLRPKGDGVDSRFYMYWMEGALKVFGLYVGQANLTTIPNLSKGRLASLVVPLPPIAQQLRIAAELASVDAKIRAEESRSVALRELYDSLLQRLMSGELRLAAREAMVDA